MLKYRKKQNDSLMIRVLFMTNSLEKELAVIFVGFINYFLL